MSRYKSDQQSLNDVYQEDGDNHFIGYDSRVHPTLLNKGIAQRSENMRFDDLTATTRKGIKRISDDVITGGTALTLPFGFGGSIPIESITYNGEFAYVQFTVAPSPLITNGDTLLITGSSDLDTNKEVVFTKIGDDGLTYEIVPAGAPSAVAGLLSQTSVGPDDGTTNSHDADPFLVVGQEYTITNFNSGDDFTDVGATDNETGEVFTCTAMKPASYANGSTLTRSNMSCSGLLGMVTDGAFATCVFSDVDTDKEYVAMATSEQAILVDPDDTDNPVYIPYDTDIVLETSEKAEILQVNNGLLIHRGKRNKAIEWDGNVSVTLPITVFSAVMASGTVTVTTLLAHGYHTDDNVIIAGADESYFNGTFSVASATSSTVFTYTATGADATADPSASITSKKVTVFAEVADTNLSAPADGGFLSMPQADFSVYHPFARLIVPLRVIELDIDVSLISEGAIATVTTEYNHGLQVGDRITVSGASPQDFNGVKEVISISDNSTDEDPATNWYLTYQYTGSFIGTASGGSKKITIDVRDQFIVSDFYDHRTYDPVNNLFRINRGTADKLVSFLIFQEDNLIALYQRSIHIISGMSTSSLEDSFVRQVTSEVGCIARKTATIVGDKMIFLSEQGVYMLHITPELNLRGVDVPLSFDIQDEFRGLNYEYIEDACATYFNNRYYIAVPSAGSERNNVVYIYNFLNKKWESKDTFAGGNNFIDNWVVARYQGQDRLFGSSIEGALQLWEEEETDELSLTGSSEFTEEQIASRLTTRRYIGGNTGTVKKFNRGTINFEVGEDDALTVSATTENPESTVTALTEVATADEDKHKRFRINKRGTGVELDIQTTEGRPQIRSVSVGSTETQLANKTFE